jgi:predicted outer membrane repeat protein
VFLLPQALTLRCCLTAAVDLFGGVIWGLDVSVQDTTFKGNSAGTDGGAVFVPPDGILAVTISTFEANTGSKSSLPASALAPYMQRLAQHSLE